MMNKIFTLLVLSLCTLNASAISPTLPASNLQVSSVEGNRFTISFSAGNGSSRIVVLKAGSPVTGLPANGNSYAFNNSFGTTGTEFTAAGEFVVYRGTGNTFTVTNLAPATAYYLSVFELNGSGISSEYLMIPLNGTPSTATAPAAASSNLTITQVAGSSFRVGITAGSGTGRLVLVRKGAPVNVTPADLNTYSSNPEFGSGAVLNGDNYAVFSGNGSVVVVSNLEPATTYHIAVFERNGQSFPVYNSSAATSFQTTNSGPTLPPSNIVFSFAEGNRLTLSIAKGNGSRRLIIARKDQAVTALPVNNTTYTGNAAFGSGTEIAPGQFVIYAGASTSLTATALEPNSTYHFRVIEYDEDLNGNTYYFNTPKDAAGNTAATPNDPGALTLASLTGTTALIQFSAISGNYRMVLGRDGAAVDGQPTQLVRYSGNTNFGLGAQLGSGNFVLSGGTNGSAISINAIQPGHTYHLAVYEFNGNNYPVYSINPVRISFTVPFEPTQAATQMQSAFPQGNQVRISWTNGNGSRRLVVGRKNTSVTAVPADGTGYTADDDFGLGTALAADQFVVYDGTNASVLVNNLEPASTYYFSVFEYNLSGTTPDYLTSVSLSGSASTAAAPSQQVGSITATNILSNSASFTYSPGNGEYQLFVMKEATAVDFDPADLLLYSSSTIFGSSALGNGNFSIHKGTNGAAFNITNLQPGTTYHLAAFGYNGNSGPVYARPAYRMQFTTAGAAPTPIPTIAATNPSATAVEGNSFKFDWTNGNGSRRLVIAKEALPVSFSPIDGGTYTGNNNWKQGTEVAGNEYVVYDGTGSTVTISSLEPGKNYHLAVFEYNGLGSTSKFLTQAFLSFQVNTLSSPTTVASQPQLTVQETNASIQWQKGNGQRSLVVLKQGSPVSQLPIDLTVYPANNNFGNGSQIGLGEFVVFSGTGSLVNISGLQNNQTYYYSIFEYNGLNGPVYLTSANLSGQFTAGTTLPVQWLYFDVEKRGNDAQLRWGTSSETGNQLFQIERAKGTGRFEPIGSQTGAVNSNNTQHYQFLDINPGTGDFRYRIRQIDIDGKSGFSAIRLINFGQPTASFQLYPNPAEEELSISGPLTNSAQVSIISITGAVVVSRNWKSGEKIRIAGLPLGSYILRIQHQANIQNLPFIKK